MFEQAIKAGLRSQKHGLVLQNQRFINMNESLDLIYFKVEKGEIPFMDI